jgi:hypothetical protein
MGHKGEDEFGLLCKDSAEIDWTASGNQYGRGQPVFGDKKGWGITAFLAASDTELTGTDSLHGRVEFLQLAGITDADLRVLGEDESRAAELIEMKRPMVRTW